MSGEHTHSYALQQAAFFIGLIPVALLFLMMIGARFFDGVRRARKPLPARPPAIVAIAPARRLAAAE